MIFNTGSTVDCPPASTIDRQVFAPSPSLLFLFRYCPYSMDDCVEEAGIKPRSKDNRHKQTLLELEVSDWKDDFTILPIDRSRRYATVPAQVGAQVGFH